MGGTGVHNPADVTGITASLATVLVNQAVIIAIVQDTNADLEIVDVNVDAIKAMTDAMAVLENAGGEITTDGFEQSVFFINIPAGVFKAINVEINFTNQTAAEAVTIRVYYRMLLGGGLVLQDTLPFAGVVSPEKVTIDLDPNRFGISVTMQRTAGNIKTYDWEAFYEV